MRVAITGAGGFLGQRLARVLLSDGTVDSLLLVDTRSSARAHHNPHGAEVVSITGDITDHAIAQGLTAFRPTALVHCAAATTGTAEGDFDLGMHVNVDGTRVLLEACRSLVTFPRFVLTSTIAVYGQQPETMLDERSFVGADSAYGIQKIVAEQLVNEYTRRGFIDGCSLRLPSVMVRDHRPPQAKSGFLSDMIDLPLRGIPFEVPVDPAIHVAIAAAKTTTSWLRHSIEIPHSSLGSVRQLQMPAICASLADLAAAVRQVGADHSIQVGAITWQPDSELEETVKGWAASLNFQRAATLGYAVDLSLESIVESAIAEGLGSGNGGLLLQESTSRAD